MRHLTATDDADVGTAIQETLQAALGFTVQIEDIGEDTSELDDYNPPASDGSPPGGGDNAAAAAAPAVAAAVAAAALVAYLL